VLTNLIVIAQHLTMKTKIATTYPISEKKEKLKVVVTSLNEETLK